MLLITFSFFVCVRAVLVKRYFRTWYVLSIHIKRLMMHLVCATQGDQRESPCLSVLPLKSLGLV